MASATHHNAERGRHAISKASPPWEREISLWGTHLELSMMHWWKKQPLIMVNHVFMRHRNGVPDAGLTILVRSRRQRVVKYPEVCEARASNWRKRIGAMGSWSYPCRPCFCRPSARNRLITRNRRTDVLWMLLCRAWERIRPLLRTQELLDCVIRD